ncbi:hypothetical protein [Epilithonimonas sp.]|uniref:hypothetical protein n=1 Tax=Epilithonimonas sp. TaxID=2894511 RepID=UPI002FDEE3E0
MEFNFEKDYILENSRVQLLPLTEEHYNDLIYFSENEPEIWNYSTGFSNASGKEQLRKYIETALLNRSNKTEYAFVVFIKNPTLLQVLQDFIIFFLIKKH